MRLAVGAPPASRADEESHRLATRRVEKAGLQQPHSHAPPYRTLLQQRRLHDGVVGEGAVGGEGVMVRGGAVYVLARAVRA